MKKQLLIAAVAATMSVSAMADISIAGAAKVNYTSVDFDGTTASTNKFSREMDLKITGKSGATTVVMNFGNDTTGAAGLSAEDTYVATSIEGVSLKVGAWDNGNNSLRASSRGDNKLSASTTMGGVTITYDASTETASSTLADTIKLSGDIAGVSASYKSVDNGEDISLSTTVSGVKVQFEDTDAAGNNSSITVSGSVSGVSVSHEIFDTKTDSKISGTFGGVTATFRTLDSDTDTADMDSVLVSTEVQGVTLTYADVDANATHSSDAFFGTVAAMTDASGFSAATSLAGNGVTFKSYEIDNVDHTKVIVNRPLANGSTFEATFHDNGVADIIDLELAVKF